MKENPYAPPTAAVADVPEALPDNSNPLFAVGTVKVFIMSLCTLGIYQLYWMYRHWRLIQARDRSDIMPFWRAFFGVIWCWPLFKRVKEDGETYGVSESFPAGIRATAVATSYNLGRVGSTLSPVLIGMAASQYSIGFGIGLLGISYLVCALVPGLFIREKMFDPQAVPSPVAFDTAVRAAR